MIDVKDQVSGEVTSVHVYEAEAVLSGIKAVSEDGRDRLVGDSVGRHWFLEADTKVDDDLMYFPVIVHRWDGG